MYDSSVWFHISLKLGASLSFNKIQGHRKTIFFLSFFLYVKEVSIVYSAMVKISKWIVRGLLATTVQNLHCWAELLSRSLQNVLQHTHCNTLQHVFSLAKLSEYGVASVSRLLKIVGRFCRIPSVLWGSFTKETYNSKEPTNRGHPIERSNKWSPYAFAFVSYHIFILQAVLIAQIFVWGVCSC